MKFFETSFLKNINVKEAFESLIYFIVDVYKDEFVLNTKLENNKKEKVNNNCCIKKKSK